MTPSGKQPCDRILGIDYGDKRIGLALSDPLCLFAYPHKTILNDTHLLGNIRREVAEYSVKKIVVGYPLREDGNKSGITLKVEAFIERLENKIKIPVIRVDERYSSLIAKNKIIESVPSRKKRRDKSLIDMNAAAEILTDYLNSLKND